MEMLKLTNESIDIISSKLGEMYENAGSTKKEVFRAKLLIEEALIKYQQRTGEDVDVYYRQYKIFGQQRFSVHIRTGAFDPFTLEENPMAFMIQSIMSSFENNMPTWKYHNLENEIMFTLRKKTAFGSLAKILVSVVAALVLGIILRMFVAAPVLNGIVNDYINPLSDAYAGMFCVMAVLLTFFAIALSIVHIGDMAAVGALGGRIMRRYFIMSAISVLVLTAPILPMFDLSGAGQLNVAAKSIYDILIGFIPTNLVAPFLNFNSVHIMIVGAMFGISLLAMGQKGSTTAALFDECNLVAVYTNNFLNKFIFIYVALKVFGLTTTSEFSKLAGAGKMVGFIVAAEIILLVFYTVYAVLKTKMPLKKFIKTVMPPFLVCLSSANFGAAFSSLFDSVLSADVDNSTASLSINLGSVFFQPACTVVFVFSALFMASSYGVEISAVWVIMAILLSIILVGAMPNIPGAAVSAITLLYAQLGIPAEGLSLMIAINAILQFVTVAIDVWCLQAEIFVLNSGLKKQNA